MNIIDVMSLYVHWLYNMILLTNNVQQQLPDNYFLSNTNTRIYYIYVCVYPQPAASLYMYYTTENYRETYIFL